MLVRNYADVQQLPPEAEKPRAAPVTTAKEYREFAEECLDAAEKANSDRKRESYLQMANRWLGAAERLENPNETITRSRGRVAKWFRRIAV